MIQDLNIELQVVNATEVHLSNGYVVEIRNVVTRVQATGKVNPDGSPELNLDIHTHVSTRPGAKPEDVTAQ